MEYYSKLLFLLLIVAMATGQDVCRDKMEQDTDFAGNDLHMVSAANATDCCNQCSAVVECKAWSLQPESACHQAGNCCYLKSSDAGRHSYPGTISGVRTYTCNNAEDCSLGGECRDGVCMCDAMWKGSSCAQLNLDPAPTARIWNFPDNNASWGGNVAFDKSDGQWHLFFAEFVDHCSLDQWGTNSVVSHAVSSRPDGPFVKQSTVLPPFHHNPTIAYDAYTDTFLLISIGNGSVSPQNCGGDRESTASFKGTTPPLKDPAAAGIITLWYSSSANGPWTLLDRPVLEGRPDKWDAFVTNPSVYIYPNGTVILAYRGGWNPWHVGIAVAKSWKEPFQRVSDDPVFSQQNEDPGIFPDHRGNFHMLTHDMTGRYGGHAHSTDGLTWTFAGQAYNGSVVFQDGTTTTFARRERPQVLLIDGTPSFLYTGVQEYGGMSYTFMQPIHQ